VERISWNHPLPCPSISGWENRWLISQFQIDIVKELVGQAADEPDPVNRRCASTILWLLWGGGENDGGYLRKEVLAIVYKFHNAFQFHQYITTIHNEHAKGGNFVLNMGNWWYHLPPTRADSLSSKFQLYQFNWEPLPSGSSTGRNFIPDTLLLSGLGEFHCGLSFAFEMILTLCHFIDCTQNSKHGVLLLRPSKIAELSSIELVFHLH
jgi:hypothetical protein